MEEPVLPDPPGPEVPEEHNETRREVVEPDKQRLGLGMLFRQLRFVLSLIFSSLSELFQKVINIKDTTDVPGTIKSIKAGIKVKGYNVWILVASAVLACIGLDTNSVAVIIGAMLISPLMSPILGVGLSIGINDRETLRDALWNFGIAVGVSLLAAFVYFLISPLGKETPEMASRTTPTLLDVMVGFFGGVAGIVAGSRKDITNAIPGVAIATALMPPLCVAGFGLAKFNIPYFAGAFYLFFLNAVFISLSTFLIVRYLNFPLKEKITRGLRKNFLRGVVFFVLTLLVPSVLLFVSVIREANLNSRVQQFVTEKFDPLEFSVAEARYIKTDSVNYLRIQVAGTRYIPRDTFYRWQGQLLPKYRLKNTELKLIQSTPDPGERDALTRAINSSVDNKLKAFIRDRELAIERQQQIEELKAEITRLQDEELPLYEIRQDLRDMMPEVSTYKVGMIHEYVAGDSTDQARPIFTIELTWGDSLPQSKADDRRELFERRLKMRYNLSNVVMTDANAPFTDQ